MKPVRKTDLNVLFPMPAQHIILSLDRLFSQAEIDLLKLGFAPREMQDKWFIYFEHDVLYFHRSWTGYCIYQVSLKGLRITQAIANRDPQQYSEIRNERDVQNIAELIDTFLLHRD